MLIVYFSLAAVIGAGLRYWASSIRFLEFSAGILLVNVIGSFLIGVVASGIIERSFPDFPRVILMVAFLGALTTFSSYALEAASLIQESKWLALAICIFSHNLLSISACYIGLKSFSLS